MKHIIMISLILVCSFVLSIAQYFVTGLYGRVIMMPIFVVLLFIYTIYVSNAKVLKK